MFLDNRKIKGNKTTKVAIMVTNAYPILAPKNTKDTIKAATPTATFNP